MAGTSRSKFYFRLAKLLGRWTGQEEKSGPDDQQQEDVDGAGEIEHRDTEKRSGR